MSLSIIRRSTTTTIPRCIRIQSNITSSRSTSRSFAMSSTNSNSRQKALSASNINPAVLEVEYAVRGELALKADKYMQSISSGTAKDLPFDKVVTANIGNPQQKGLNQQPITYWRQVISLLEYPDLMQGDLLPLAEKIYPKDVIKRAKGLWEEIGSVGAYSASKGIFGIRQRVAQFLEGESLSHFGQAGDLYQLSIRLVCRPPTRSTARGHNRPEPR